MRRMGLEFIIHSVRHLLKAYAVQMHCTRHGTGDVVGIWRLNKYRMPQKSRIRMGLQRGA
jgi:hypothetical protein